MRAGVVIGVGSIGRRAWLAAVLLAAMADAQDTRRSLLVAPERGPADEARRTPLAVAVERARPAVVHVFVEASGRGQPFKVERPGSGCVVDGRGLVVTAWSLVKDAFEASGKPLQGRRVMVQLGSEGPDQQQEAKLVGRAERDDLALLAVSPGEAPLVALELAHSARAMAGEPVAVLSFHDGKDRVASAGICVPPSGPTTLAGGALTRQEFLLTDAVIDRRGHGGALLDAAGRLLGVCNSEHVRPDVREPELADLKKPTFGIVVPSDSIRRAFAKELALEKLGNATLLAPPPPDAAEDATRVAGPARALAKAADALVSVFCGEGEPPAPLPDDPHANRRRPGLGSGVIVSARGLVLTNAHVVSGAPNKVRVTLRDGKTCKASRLAEDLTLNVALLELDLPAGTKLAPIELGDSERVMLGEHVLAVGLPYGTAPTPRLGVLSARRGQGRLQADCDLGNANGGGAVIDMSGRLIGLADGGRIDPIDAAWAVRGDDAKAETNLSTFAAIHAVQARFGELASLPRQAGDPALRESALTRVVERCADALLNVYVSRSSAAADLEDNPFAQAEPTIAPEGLGSGVIVDPSGLALTNWHVVDAATEPDGSMRRDHAVHARLRSGKVYEVRVLSISREDDLALVRLVLAPGESVTAMELGHSSDLCVGETVLAMGNPMGRANTITAGVVCALDQGIHVKRRWAKLENLIETDAAINGGNSGGPLVDLAGRLAGINSAGGSGFARTAYAIAVDHVRRRLHGLLLSPAKLRSAYLGVTLGSKEMPPVVVEVDPQGPAARAGIAVGDKVVSLGGDRVEWSVGFALALIELPCDREVELGVERGGQALKTNLRPLAAAQWAVQRQTGLEVEPLTVQTDRETVTKAWLELHRAFTGDPQVAPGQLPGQALRVSRVFVPDVAVEKDDLLLAAEVSQQAAASLVPFTAAEDLQRFVNSSSEYEEGSKHQVWVFRQGKCRKVELRAKRLML